MRWTSAVQKASRIQQVWSAITAPSVENEEKGGHGYRWRCRWRLDRIKRMTFRSTSLYRMYMFYLKPFLCTLTNPSSSTSGSLGRSLV